jgi:Ca-activated chloride channel homolog
LAIIKFKYRLTLLLLFTWSLTVVAQQSNASSSSPTKTRILFLLDGSGSMNADWNNEVRIVAAKNILGHLIDSLKVYPQLELALRVYGHQSHKDLNNCKDTKLEVAFKASNHQSIKDKLETISPKGVTPLAYSLEQAANDFTPDPNARNVIIIITDGLESCDGDPCKISQALQRRNIFLKPFVVGIGIEKNYAAQFDCIGTFYNANDQQDFKLLLRKVINQSLGETQVRVDLLDGNGKPKETDVNVSFENNITQQTMYNYVHFIGSSGKPDLLKVDPISSYNIRVNTIPVTYKKNVYLEGGKLNVIEIDVPQGFLAVKQEGYLEYKGLQALARLRGSSEIIHTFEIGGEDVKLLVGDYEIEVLTLPRIIKRVSITSNQTTTVQLESPGRMTILDHKVGYGSLYEIDDYGRETWLFTLPVASSRTSVAMQPGNYRVVYRSKLARNVDATYSSTFTIKSGASTSIKLFN